MKKRSGLLAALLAVLLLTAAALSGCGSSAPTANDAQKYVQAVLDLMCTGEYDKSVNFADVEDGKELEMRNEVIDEMLASITEGTGMDEETKGRFRDFILQAFKTCKYSVGEAVKTDDKGSTGYDVTVTIEPFKAFDGVTEAVQEKKAALTADVDKLMSMTEDEVSSQIYDALFTALDKNLDSPSYDTPREIVVHYGLIDEEKEVYGTGSEDGEKLGGALFSMAGLEQQPQ